MNHLDNDWSESSFLERWQTVLFVFLVLFAMIATSAYFLGTNGILKIVGLVDDTFHGSLTITVSPDNAILQVDFQSCENGESKEVSWSRDTDHIISVNHPAYKSEKFLIHVPKEKEQLPYVSNASDNIRFEISDNHMAATITLVSEYVSRQIKSKPAGVSISINQVDTGKKTPMSFEFKTGDKYTIVADKKGYEPKTIEFKADNSNQNTPVFINLKRIPKPKIPQGKLILRNSYPVNIYSGSKLLIRNKKAATIFLKPGTYNLKISNSKYFLNNSQTVKILDGKSVRISVEPPGSVEFKTSPSKAEVYIDEKKLGVTPGTFKIAPGLYNFVFKWDNCEDTESRWIKVISDELRTVPLIRGCK